MLAMRASGADSRRAIPWPMPLEPPVITIRRGAGEATFWAVTL
jgi:hypothetical protein